MTIRFLYFSPLPVHKEKENLAQVWPSTDIRALFHLLSFPIQAKSKLYILELKVGGEERHIYFAWETPGIRTLSYFVQWTRNTRWHLPFSWVGGFSLHVHYTQQRFLPHTGRHWARGKTLEQSAGQQEQPNKWSLHWEVWERSRLCIKREGVSSCERTAHKKPGVNLLLLGGLNGSWKLNCVFTAFWKLERLWAAVG